jgi:hypothetical protein
MLRDVVERPESLASTELIQGDEENVCDRRYGGHSIKTNARYIVAVICRKIFDTGAVHRRVAAAAKWKRKNHRPQSNAGRPKARTGYKHSLNRKSVLKYGVQQLEFVTSVLGFAPFLGY